MILPAGTPITATSDSYDPSAKIPQGELKLYAKYLGVNELDNTHNTYNPSTGDNAERKPAAVVAIIALITVIAACSLDKRYHRT